MEPVSYRERVRSGVEQDSRMERSRVDIVELVPEPADMAQVADGGGAGGLDLDGNHRAVAPFQNQVDLALLMVPVMEHTHTTVRGGQLNGISHSP